jgi:hypothetical protein
MAELRFRGGDMANGGTTPAEASEPESDASRTGFDLARHPIAQTVLFLGLGALAFALLGLEQGTSDLAKSDEWLIWKGTAAAGQATAVTLLVHGIAKLSAVYLPGDQKLYGVSIAAAIVLVVGVWYGVQSMINSDRDWAIPAMEYRLEGVVLVGTACATPWVAAVWIAYRRVQEAATTAKLLAVWDLVIAIAQAFALFVVVAVLPTGALLKLWLAQATTDEQVQERREVFDAEHVALYGAMYGLIVVAVVLPLIVAWRARAKSQIERQHPPVDGEVTSDWYENRAAHEKLLGLDVALIRNPLTALTVLTPLLTSVVATYLPSLSDKA